MEPLGRGTSLGEDFGAGRIGRRALLRSMLVLGGGLAMAACGAVTQTAPGSAGGWGGLPTKRSGWAA